MSEEKEWRDLLLTEIRDNRKAISSLKESLSRIEISFNSKIGELDKNVFANKLKLSVVISGISIGTSILYAYVSKKIGL